MPPRIFSGHLPLIYSSASRHSMMAFRKMYLDAFQNQDNTYSTFDWPEDETDYFIPKIIALSMAVAEMNAIGNRLASLQKTYKTEPQRSGLKECLRQVEAHEEGELGAFIESKPMLLDTIVTLLDSTKVPLQVIEIIHILLASDVLPQEYVLGVVNRLGRPAWNSQAKMKLLQMFFYLTRYDIYSGKEAFGLLYFIMGCFEPGDPSLDSAARPIATLLIEKILKRAVVSDAGYCGLGMASLKTQAESERMHPSKDDMDVNTGVSERNLAICCTAAPDSTPLVHSRSHECLQSDSVSYTGDILKLLDAVYIHIHNKGVYSIGCILLSFVKHPGIFAVPGIEEFMNKKFFVASFDILKYGRPEDKEPIYLAIIKIQEKYGTMLSESLRSFYNKLPKLYDDKNANFYSFIHGLFGAFVRVSPENGADSSRPFEVPVPLYDIYDRVVNELQLSKKGDHFKVRFIEETLRLFKNSGQLYNNTVDAMLSKIQETKEVSLSTNSFMRDSLHITAQNGNRGLFERILSICPEELLLDASFELKWFMADSWFIVINRTTSTQRRNILITNLRRFNVEELGYLIRYLEQDEIEPAFNAANELLVRRANLGVFEDLIKKVEGFEVLSQILMRFYGSLQSSRPVSPDAAEVGEPVTDFDPEKLATNNIRYDREDFSIPTSPLDVLKRYVENNPQCYKKALACLTDIIRVADPSELWGIVFSVVDVCREAIDDQVPILLSITENHINSLQDKYLIKVLNILKRMCQSRDCNTCLNALFIYQEVGEFLITKSIVERDSNGLPEIYGTNNSVSSISAQEHDGAPACQQPESNIRIWRDFVIVGAFVMKDSRSFMEVSIIKYLMSFVKAEYSFFDDNDFKFIEKIVFSQMLKPEDPEVALFVLQELNEYIKGYSLHDFIKDYTKHLTRLVIDTDDIISRKALDGLKIIFGQIYKETNYVVCGAAACDQNSLGKSARTELEDETSTIPYDRPFGGDIPAACRVHPENVGQTDFVIRSKTTHPMEEKVAATFLQLLQHSDKIKMEHLRDILQLFVLFPYTANEMDEFVNLMEAKIQQDSASSECIIDAIESMCSTSCEGGLSLLYFSRWLNEKTIASLQLHDGDKLVSDLLLFRIGEIMRRQGPDGHFGEILQRLLSYAREETTEEVLDCVLRGCTGIGSSKDFEVLIRFSYDFFTTRAVFSASRRRERKYIEFLTFYHSQLQRHFSARSNAGEAESSPSIQHAYELVVFLTQVPHRNLRLRGYQVLFADVMRCRNILLSRLKGLFYVYIVDFARTGEAMHNTRVTELLYCLRCLVILADPTVIDALKGEMADLLICGDPSILDSVRKCFKVLFAGNKACSN